MDITRSDHFLTSFFQAGGNNPLWERSLRHFELAFVEPPRFKSLLADLTPVEGCKKVVVVDGHPRSGKTWTVVKALATLISELDLTPDEWWTSGLDSLGVLPNDSDTLRAGASLIESQLRHHPEYRLVLLDDLLGTNQLRPFGDSISDQSLKPFLLWDPNTNPWLRNMSESSVLVLTGRSLHFMLLDILLGLETRRGIENANGLTVINSRRGLFRTVDQGEFFGAFDEDTLREVCEKNRQHHPLRDEDPDWIVIATPLLAFDDCAAHSQSQDDQSPHVLTKDQKELAASGLFGEDVDSFAETIGIVEAVVDEQSVQWRENVLPQLYKAYLVIIAPGLLFLDQTAYRQLGLDDEIKDLVVKGLYLNETIDDFCSGRLPNEFYMIALNDHFVKHLDLAAKTFAMIANPTGGELWDAEGIPGLGVRGLLERGLHRKNSGSLKTLLSVKEFRYVVDTYLNHKNDCLLHLERGDSPSNQNCGVQISPGLAAAIGWALNSFFGPSEERVKQTVTEWFPSKFRFLLEELSAEFRIWATDPNMPESSRDQSILPDYDVSKWKVTATYSAFLQWVIRMDATPEKGGLLDEMIRLPQALPDIIRQELRLIVDDELVWAFGECGYSRGSLPLDNSLLGFLHDETEPHLIHTSAEHTEQNQLKVNRLFSFAWHNKWMEQPESEFAKKASDWIKLHQEDALVILNDAPELIDDNLQYHWFHFIAQRAVWMRDWCFQEDPNEFERNYSQITEGSSQAKDNELLMRLATTLMKAPFDKDRLRNVLMLLGTRASRILAIEEVTCNFDGLPDRNTDLDKELREAVLQAIFELARQGFLEASSQNGAPSFHLWCKEKIQAFRGDLESAWSPYWDGLNAMTHLDLLPRQTGGWEDVLPKRMLSTQRLH